MKHLLFSLGLLFMGALVSQAQTKEEIKKIMLQNEDFFLNVVATHYPLSHQQIETYRNQIDFVKLSKNPNIAWSDEFMEQYKADLSMHNLLGNRGVNWDEERIKKYYQDESFEFRTLVKSNKIYLSEESFEKMKHKIGDHLLQHKSDKEGKVLVYFEWKRKVNKSLEKFVNLTYAQRQQQYTHPPEFQKLMQDDITTIDFEVLYEQRDLISWSSYLELEDVNLDWENFKLLDGYLKWILLTDCKYVIDQYVFSNLDNTDINSLLDIFKEKDSNRLYEVTNHILGEGYSTDVGFINEREDDFWKQNQLDDYFPAELANDQIEINVEYNTPEEFYDYHEFDAWTKVPVKVVSIKLKYILENFSLPEHRFYPIQLRMNSKDWGKDSRDYYVFICDTLILDHLEVDKAIYRKDGLVSHDTIPTEGFRFNDRRLEILPNEYPKYKGYKYSELHLDHQFDLCNIRHADLWVSQRLLDCIKENGIKGFNIRQSSSMSVYNNSKESVADYIPIAVDLDTIPETVLKSNYNSIKDSIDKLIKNAPKDYVKMIYDNRNNLTELDKKIMNFEIENDIVLPTFYKDILKNPEAYELRPKYKSDFQSFSLFKLEEIQFSGNDGWDAYPRAIKSIAIAGDGVGDYLSLFLEADSPHHLSSKVYFLMYGGEIIESEKLEFIFKKK